MGTRQYADAVVQEIDPDHSIFQDRIMSRDENDRKSKSENRSSTKKSLDRLFSSDKSMVAIIDDRMDVWDYSPHLVHIKPYVFFKGTGDINSPFANKKQSLDQQFNANENQKKATDENEATEENNENDLAEVLESQKREQDALAKQQQQERPLAQKQRELGASHQAVLVDDDRVLYEKLDMFTRIHSKFYSSYDAKLQQLGDSADTTNPFATMPSIVDCINPFRKHILSDIHILFSGMIKLDADPKSSHWWKTSESYGATCHVNLSSKITHLIAAKAGTSKTIEANKQFPDVHVVNPNWLIDSIYHEGAQDESLYRLTSGGPSTSMDSLNGNDDVANPESTPLDLEDGAFDNHELDLQHVDWNDADDEVNEFLSDSDENDDDASVTGDTDNNLDGDDTTSSQQKPNELSRKRTREGDSQELEYDKGYTSEKDERAIKKTKLHLNSDANTTATVSEHSDQEGYSTGEDSKHDNGSNGHRTNSGDSESDFENGSSELDDLADLLDEGLD
ncbi:unnamed protein product [Absidia cylindrospora]